MRLLLCLPYCLVVVVPLVALLIAALSGADATGVATQLLSLRQATLLLHTVVYCAVAALSTGALAVLAASRLWTWRRGIASHFRWLLLAGLAIPAVIHVLAWQGLQRLGAGLFRLPDLAGYPGATWVAILTYLPLAVLLLLVSLESIDQRQLDAARLLATDRRCLHHIALGLIRPQLTAVCCLVLLMLAADLTIPALLSIGCYTTEIHAYFCGGGSLAGVLRMAWPLLAVAAVVAWPILPGLGALVAGRMRRQSNSAVTFQPGTLLGWAQTVAVAVLVLQLVGTLAGLGAMCGGLAAVSAAIGSAQREILVSAEVISLAGIAALVLALPAGTALSRSTPPRWAWSLLLLPLIVPAPLIGIGLIATWNRPVTAAVYGSLAMPVLALAARFALVPLLIIHAWYRRIDRRLLDAARVYQPGAIAGWWRIQLPLLAPALLVALVFMLVLGLGELSATLLVVPAGRSTLIMRIYNYLHYGASERIAGLGLTLVLATIVLLAAAGLMIARREPRPHRGN